MKKGGKGIEQMDDNELMFKLIVEASPSALILVNYFGEITFVNKFTETLFQYNRSELIGKDIKLLIPHDDGKNKPSTKSKKNCQEGIFKELFALKKGNVKFPIEISLNTIDTTGGSYVLAAVVDLTEQKKAENQFKLVVESVPVSIIMVNSFGKIILTNRETEIKFGYTGEELYGKELEILIPNRFRNGHISFRDMFLSKPNQGDMGAGRDLFALKRDKTEFPVEISLNPIEINSEDFVLASIIDISERKKIESEAIIRKQLTQLTDELNKANVELKYKNDNINHSIDYAYKIQYSILPEIDLISEHLSDFNLYFTPKNVIGGDFYWFMERDEACYIAAIDCTGHSIPGAMISMIIFSLLNEVMIKESNLNTGEVLNRLHSRLYKFLQQEKGDDYSQDGCDISLCRIDKSNKELQYSGARQNIYLCYEDDIVELKATPKSIGGYSLSGVHEPERDFYTQRIRINEGMLVAMATDGVLDQLDEHDEIFGTNKLKRLIKESYVSSGDGVTKNYNTVLNNWKKNTIQQDDMLLLTFKINLKNV